jgi:hypothetical protein
VTFFATAVDLFGSLIHDSLLARLKMMELKATRRRLAKSEPSFAAK